MQSRARILRVDLKIHACIEIEEKEQKKRIKREKAKSFAKSCPKAEKALGDEQCESIARSMPFKIMDHLSELVLPFPA